MFIGHFCPPGSGYGSKDYIESGYNPDTDPDPQHCLYLMSTSREFGFGVFGKIEFLWLVFLLQAKITDRTSIFIKGFCEYF
jgi:hypothetical protein